MPQNHGPCNPKLLKRSLEQTGLCVRSPDPVARARAVPISGTVKDDDAMLPCRQINKSAGGEILDHAAVAMQENQHRTLALLNVMEADAIHLDKTPKWGVMCLGPSGKPLIDKSRYGQGAGGNGKTCGPLAWPTHCTRAPGG